MASRKAASPKTRRPKATAKKSPVKVSGKSKIEFASTFDPDANKHLRNYVPPSDRPVRIYCDGIYDLFHYGHARSLEQAKNLFPNVELIVGVCNDELTLAKKGRTVMDEHERAESLRHCKWVDEVVENAPWVVDQDFIKKHRIDFIAHDDIPYSGEGVVDIYQEVKRRGQFIATQRTSGISTSDLITRIVRDYDSYIRRNLSRGASPKDLNISIFKQGEIKMEKFAEDINKKLTEQRKRIKANWTNTGRELVEVLKNWEHKSASLIKDFTRIFDIGQVLHSLTGSPKKEPTRPSRLGAQ